MACFHEIYSVKSNFSETDYNYLKQLILSERSVESENRTNTIGASSMYEVGKTFVTVLEVLSSLIAINQIEIVIDDGTGFLQEPAVIVHGSGLLNFSYLFFVLPEDLVQEIGKNTMSNHDGMYPKDRVFDISLRFYQKTEDDPAATEYSKYVFEIQIECEKDHFNYIEHWDRNPNRMLSYAANFPIPTMLIEDVANQYVSDSTIREYLSKPASECSEVTV